MTRHSGVNTPATPLPCQLFALFVTVIDLFVRFVTVVVTYPLLLAAAEYFSERPQHLAAIISPACPPGIDRSVRPAPQSDPAHTRSLLLTRSAYPNPPAYSHAPAAAVSLSPAVMQAMALPANSRLHPATHPVRAWAAKHLANASSSSQALPAPLAPLRAAAWPATSAVSAAAPRRRTIRDECRPDGTLPR